MNKSDLVRRISRRSQIPQPEVEKMIESLLAIIVESLASGNSVMISNFGKFETREHGATTRRNPRTGEEVKVEAKRAVLFHPSPAFKDGVQE